MHRWSPQGSTCGCPSVARSPRSPRGRAAACMCCGAAPLAPPPRPGPRRRRRTPTGVCRLHYPAFPRFSCEAAAAVDHASGHPFRRHGGRRPGRLAYLMFIGMMRWFWQWHVVLGGGGSSCQDRVPATLSVWWRALMCVCGPDVCRSAALASIAHWCRVMRSMPCKSRHSHAPCARRSAALASLG